MINNQFYINLESYVDLEKFDSLHYKICRGFAKSRHLAAIGNLEDKMENIFVDPAYTHLCQVYNDFKKLPESSAVKQASRGLDTNELAVFLKYSLQGYDLYNTYYIQPLREYFPEIYQWVANLRTIGIFSNITEARFLALDSGGIAFEHYHDDSGSLCEFIHIRPKSSRPFYLKERRDSEKVYIEPRVVWFDDRMIHGGDPIMAPTYTLRVDGTFTDTFRKKILND